MEAIAIWRSPIEVCLRPTRCSSGRSTVAFPSRVCLLYPVTRPTAPPKTRRMDRPALRAIFRSPPPPPNTFLKARIAFRPLRAVLRLGAPGAAPSSMAPQPEPDHRTGASLTRFCSVDDVDNGDGEDGDVGMLRMSLIEVLPSVFWSLSTWYIRRFPTIKFSSCLSDGL